MQWKKTAGGPLPCNLEFEHSTAMYSYQTTHLAHTCFGDQLSAGDRRVQSHIMWLPGR